MTAARSPTSLLAKFVAEHRCERIPEGVLHAARRALVDHIGVTVSGSADDATRRARDAIAASESGGGATVVGDRMRVSAPFAAFLNAFASHVLDLDDVYNPPGTTVHGSCSVWPAILAVADTRPVTGRDALASFALGFEVGDAGRATPPAKRTTTPAGTSRARPVTSVRRPPRRARWASAASRSSTRSPRAPPRPRGCGSWRAATSRACTRARPRWTACWRPPSSSTGLTASAKALEGDFGYLAVMSADPAPEKISEGLGETWNLTDNGHKLYPSGSLTHPMIDGVIALVTENDVAPERCHRDRRPGRPARGAIHRPAATDHAHAGEVQPAALRGGCGDLPAGGHRGAVDAVLARPDVIELRDRVKVVTDPALGKQDADVEITLASGRTLSTAVRGNRGTPCGPARRRRTRREVPRAGRPGSRRGAHRAAAGDLLARRRASRRLGPARADRPADG